MESQQVLEPPPETQSETNPDSDSGGPASEQQATTEQSGSAEFLPAVQGIEAAIRDLVAEQRRATSQDPNDHEIRDLKAQEKMATWALWMFVATAATVILTFAALVAIIRTLHHTKRAADAAVDMVTEAKATTQAANDTVAATRDIGQRQIRAYLILIPKMGWIAHPLGKRELTAQIGFDVRNTGNTPATGCVIQYYCEIISDDVGRVEIGKKLRKEETPVTHCAPGKFGPAVKVSVQQSKVQSEIIDPGKEVFFMARVQYIDCFKRAFYTDACGSFMFHEVPPIGDPERVAASISFRLHREYNTAS